jgi:hypothetical protein
VQTKGPAFQRRLASWSEKDLELCTDLLRKPLDMPGNQHVERP